jgi:hypothetical protein
MDVALKVGGVLVLCATLGGIIYGGMSSNTEDPERSKSFHMPSSPDAILVDGRYVDPQTGGRKTRRRLSRRK